MKRFYHENNRTWTQPLLSVFIFLALLISFFNAVTEISNETSQKQAETLRLSISRGIAHCYATEGMYPESLEHLEEHYGITYDSDKYFVDYQVIGKNIFPDVTVIEK